MPSLINLMVSADLKYHDYLRIHYHLASFVRVLQETVLSYLCLSGSLNFVISTSSPDVKWHVS